MIINHFFSSNQTWKKRIESYIFCGNKIREMIFFFTFIYTALDGIRSKFIWRML